MESKKVKEIKKCLVFCKDRLCEVCPRLKQEPNQEEDCRCALIEQSLTLINELESENEELFGLMNIANERKYRKKFNDEWRKEYQKELDKQGNGHIAGYPDFDLVYKLYFEQKDRIAELETLCNKTYEDLTKEIDRLKNQNKRLMQSNENVHFADDKLIERNKELEEALLDMVVQFCQMDKEGYLNHTFMSAEENAFDVLDIDYGEKVDDVYERFNTKWKTIKITESEIFKETR